MEARWLHLEADMTKHDQTKGNEQVAAKGQIVQQFAAGGSAVSTPELPYDVEKVRISSVKVASKPTGSEPSK